MKKYILTDKEFLGEREIAIWEYDPLLDGVKMHKLLFGSDYQETWGKNPGNNWVQKNKIAESDNILDVMGEATILFLTF